MTGCDTLGVFHEGLATAEDSSGKFHVLLDGSQAYPQRYEKVEYFQGGLAWVQKKDSKWIRIDKQGKEVQMRSTSSIT